MGKYIDAEKLIAEIERRINSWSIRGENSPVGQGKDTCVSRVTELSDLLCFITSLQQEQPEIDLEKEIQDWCKENVTGVKPIYTADSLIYDLLPKTARYFYELGKNVSIHRLFKILDKEMAKYDIQQLTSKNPDYEQGAMDALYNLKLISKQIKAEEIKVEEIKAEEIKAINKI